MAGHPNDSLEKVRALIDIVPRQAEATAAHHRHAQPSSSKTTLSTTSNPRNALITDPPALGLRQADPQLAGVQDCQNLINAYVDRATVEISRTIVRLNATFSQQLQEASISASNGVRAAQNSASQSIEIVVKSADVATSSASADVTFANRAVASANSALISAQSSASDALSSARVSILAGISSLDSASLALTSARLASSSDVAILSSSLTLLQASVDSIQASASSALAAAQGALASATGSAAAQVSSVLASAALNSVTATRDMPSGSTVTPTTISGSQPLPFQLPPNFSLTPGKISGIIVGAIVITVLLCLVIYFRIIRTKGRRRDSYLDEKSILKGPREVPSRMSSTYRPGNGMTINFDPAKDSDAPSPTQPALRQREGMYVGSSGRKKKPALMIIPISRSTGGISTSAYPSWPLTATTRRVTKSSRRPSSPRTPDWPLKLNGRDPLSSPPSFTVSSGRLDILISHTPDTRGVEGAATLSASEISNPEQERGDTLSDSGEEAEYQSRIEKADLPREHPAPCQEFPRTWAPRGEDTRESMRGDPATDHVSELTDGDELNSRCGDNTADIIRGSEEVTEHPARSTTESPDDAGPKTPAEESKQEYISIRLYTEARNPRSEVIANGSRDSIPVQVPVEEVNPPQRPIMPQHEPVPRIEQPGTNTLPEDETLVVSADREDRAVSSIRLALSEPDPPDQDVVLAMEPPAPSSLPQVNVAALRKTSSPRLKITSPKRLNSSGADLVGKPQPAVDVPPEIKRSESREQEQLPAPSSPSEKTDIASPLITSSASQLDSQLEKGVLSPKTLSLTSRTPSPGTVTAEEHQEGTLPPLRGTQVTTTSALEDQVPTSSAVNAEGPQQVPKAVQTSPPRSPQNRKTIETDAVFDDQPPSGRRLDSNERQNRGRSMIRTSDIVAARLSAMALLTRERKSIGAPEAPLTATDHQERWLERACILRAEIDEQATDMAANSPLQRNPVDLAHVPPLRRNKTSQRPTRRQRYGAAVKRRSSSLSPPRQPSLTTRRTPPPMSREQSPLRRNPYRPTTATSQADGSPSRAAGLGRRGPETRSNPLFAQSLSKFQTLAALHPQDAILASDEVTSRAIAGIYIPGSLREQAVRNPSRRREGGPVPVRGAMPEAGGPPTSEGVRGRLFCHVQPGQEEVRAGTDGLSLA
ncbi:hypothetical protein B2J93_609 [Marssonina coronariae]|uniref:Uncharacterized protein n=1 Tax=Diplocarpon coronariae TaxID=2795749 RepID=A0A218ZAE9_9HELO|nr:hypothetical protein B2J93_609 [Marssonina coronariae]